MNKQNILQSPIYPLICRIVSVFGLKIKRINGGQCSFAKDALFRKSKIKINGKGSSVIVGKKCRFRNTIIEVIGYNSTVKIGDSVAVQENCYISIVGDNCRCVIGNKENIGGACFFLEENNTEIFVGNDCFIGRDVVFRTTDFHSVVDATTGKRINYPANVTVGNHVWLGSNVTLGKGTVVSDNSVVAAHSVVTKKYTQSNVLLAGIPAKIIKENINWCKEKLE